MKTLHVHIGTSKTGTTSIQKFCKENETILNKKGYCFPLVPFPNTVSAVEMRNGRFLIGTLPEIEDREKRKAEERKYFQEGMQKINELFQKYDHVILSDETIWARMSKDNKDVWEKLKDCADKGGFAVHVVVYLRRQDKFLISVWNQKVKARRDNFMEVSFEEFAGRINKNVSLMYYEKLEWMSGFVGKENITVRRFDGKFYGGSLYADFLQAIGLPLTDEFSIPEEGQNPGLYGNTIELKRILNTLPQMEDEKMERFIRSVLLECSASSIKEYPCEMMSVEEIAQWMDEYGPGNRRIAEEYLHEPGAELFDVTIKSLPKWEKGNPYMIDDVIRFTGAASIILYQECHKLKVEIYKMKHPIRWICKKLLKKLGINK